MTRPDYLSQPTGELHRDYAEAFDQTSLLTQAGFEIRKQSIPMLYLEGTRA